MSWRSRPLSGCPRSSWTRPRPSRAGKGTSVNVADRRVPRGRDRACACGRRLHNACGRSCWSGTRSCSSVSPSDPIRHARRVRVAGRAGHGRRSSRTRQGISDRPRRLGAAARSQVSYVDAGRNVEQPTGAYTDRLPCTEFDQDCGPDGTTVVRGRRSALLPRRRRAPLPGLVQRRRPVRSRHRRGCQRPRDL